MILFNFFALRILIKPAIPLIYPLSYFPQGGKDGFTLPPWGKAGKGVATN